MPITATLEKSTEVRKSTCILSDQVPELNLFSLPSPLSFGLSVVGVGGNESLSPKSFMPRTAG